MNLMASYTVDGQLIDFSLNQVYPFHVEEGEDIRAKILALESVLATHEQLPIETIHHFAKGLYAREILIPKGTVLTGKIHKESHLNIISKGDISVITEEGVKRIRAPFSMVSQAGMKRAGYAHEDTVWTTIHACEETDLDAVEKKLIAKTFDEVRLLT